VEDAAGTSGLFSNGSTATTEYTYDNNGNLKSDLNKGISIITYNCLNLPLSMTFSNGSTIAYTYDANGRKLRTVHNVGGTTTTTDYAGNVIYENGVQKKLLTEEGYVDLTSGTYYYYLKDHQGNNRVVVNSGGTVTETNHYYPFGGTFASGTVQPYKYNGKELDTKGGLNWYDYGVRHYDAALGRFTTQDRFAEKYSALSPYQYGANSPVNTIDINGDSLKVITKEAILAIYNGLEKGTKLNIQFNNGVLDPNSIKEEMSNSSDFFLKDLYEIAINPKMVELSLSNINIFKKDGTVYSEKFGMPYDDDDGLISNKEELQALGIPIGRHIQGNLGQTLVPDINLPSGKKSTNNSVQILINSNGNLNHRTVGIAHEFGHVILYLRNLPFSHTQPGVDVFINKRATSMSKRLGYEY
jgi:RHS repeat-associated protein